MRSKKKHLPVTLKELNRNGYLVGGKEEEALVEEVLERQQGIPSNKRKWAHEFVRRYEPESHTFNISPIEIGGMGLILASLRHPVDQILAKKLPYNTRPETYAAKRAELMRQLGHSRKRFFRKCGKKELEDPSERVFVSKYALNRDIAPRVIREGKVLSGKDVTHSSIPRAVYVPETIEDAMKKPITMPFYQGKDLGKILVIEPSLRKRFKSGLDALKALAAIHRKTAKRKEGPLLHRDVKPNQFLLMPNGHVMVLDWGFVNDPATEKLECQGERLTNTEFTVGDPGHMSPEEINGKRKYNERSEVYCSASTAFEILTGKTPYYDVANKAPKILERLGVDIGSICDPVQATLMMKTLGIYEITPPHELDKNISIGASRVIMRGLSHDPRKRYASLTAFVRDLSRQRITSGEKIRVSPKKTKVREKKRRLAVFRKNKTRIIKTK